MAEPFNVEQFRQRMNGDAPQIQPQPEQAFPLSQPYQQQSQTQGQTEPYQPYHAAQPQYHAQPYAAPPQQALAPQMPSQLWQPQHQPLQQPQTPVHHMPPPPVFAPPPGGGDEKMEQIPTTSRFKLKRGTKVKSPKAPKVKKSKADKSNTVHTTKTSPSIIFMFGMATGIVCFLVGNIVMSNVLTDKTAKSFREIERRNAQAQQPVLPKTAQNLEDVVRPEAP